MCTGMRMATEGYTHGAVASGRRFLMGSAIVSALDQGLVGTMGCKSVGKKTVKKKKWRRKRAGMVGSD